MALAGSKFNGRFDDLPWRAMRALGKALPWLFVAISPLVIYHRVCFGSGLKSAHFWGDTTNAYWPDLAFFTRSIAQGEIPLWNPNERGGFPFAFDPQPGVLYPLNWLLVVIGLGLGHVPYALLQFKILAHLSITCLGWYAWLGRRVSRTAAVVGALGATFGCYTLQHVHYGLVWPIAFVPWFLTALDRWLTTRRTLAALGMGASVGAIVAAGSPPAALYGLMVCAILGTPQVLSALFRATGKQRRELLVTGAVGAIVAILLSAPIIVGTQQLTAASVLEKRDFDYISSGSLKFSDLTAFLYPSTSGALIYLGSSLVGLALIGIGFRWRARLTLLAIALGAGGLLLALGANTPVLKWVVDVFPPVRYFRLAFRYLYLTQIAIAVLAAIGTDVLIGPRRRASVARLVLGGIVLASALFWIKSATMTTDDPRLLIKDLHDATRWLGLTFFVGLLCAFRGLARWASGAFALVVIADFAAFVPRTNVLKDGPFELPHNISDAALDAIKKATDEYRVWDEFGLGFRAGSRLGIRDLRGYMDPLRLANYETMASQLMVSPALLQRWGVKWALPADHPYVGSGHKRVNFARLREARVREPHVWELPGPRPPAFFTDFVDSRKSEAGVWAVLQGNPLGARVQVPPLTQPGAPDPLGAGSASANPSVQLPAIVVERRHNRLVFSIEATRPGWFVVNEAYFPGWRASIDGSTVPIYRVDGWIRGLPMAPGAHRIEMKFRPMQWLTLASVAVVVWIGIGGMLVYAGISHLRAGRK